MNQLEEYVHGYFGIQQKNLSPITSLFTETVVNKNDYYLKVGQFSSKLSFIKSGYLRIFATDHKGDKEITQWISTQGMFVTDLSSLIFKTPSRWNIQALSDCVLYTISQEQYMNIDQKVKNWHELEKLFIAKCFVTLENRVFNQLSMTAEEKYNHLFEMDSKLFNHVPLQYLASMMGMTPETLSRIRRKLSS